MENLPVFVIYSLRFMFGVKAGKCKFPALFQILSE